jgi:chemotaxis protein CheD
MTAGHHLADEGPTDRVRVGVAELAVASGETRLTTSGLGSCVGVAVADPERAIAGLAHVMLPELPEGRDETERPAKVVTEGVERLLTAVESAGGEQSRVEAKLAGGSRMFDFSGVGDGVGERNVERSRDALAAADVPVVADDVGGEHGRSLELHPETWTLAVRSTHEGDREL